MRHVSIILAFLLSLCCAVSCAQGKQDKASQTKEKKNMKTEKKVLVAYFSRTGENYAVGNIKKGNTHIIAEMIAEQTGVKIFEIVPTKPYPNGYDACVEMAKKEKEAKARPEVKGDIRVENYDVIFLGYPNWWGDMPMPVYTFMEKHDWKGKIVVPFCTNEGSGLSDTEEYIAKACGGATVESGFSILGHIAQNSQAKAKKEVEEWLSQLKSL